MNAHMHFPADLLPPQLNYIKIFSNKILYSINIDS